MHLDKILLEKQRGKLYRAESKTRHTLFHDCSVVTQDKALLAVEMFLEFTCNCCLH